jgi:hypothetical protein
VELVIPGKTYTCCAVVDNLFGRVTYPSISAERVVLKHFFFQYDAFE